MLIGEQPGDKEDLDGRPFVGPAGGVLDRALEAAGIERRQVYLTNAVKHFKWKRQGKVRLHQKPNAEEVRGAAWWRGEVDAVDPDVVVLLGATAAQAALGPKVRVTRDRGVVSPPATGSPTTRSSPSTRQPCLRMRDPERDAAFAELVHDLEEAARHVGAG